MSSLDRWMDTLRTFECFASSLVLNAAEDGTTNTKKRSAAAATTTTLTSNASDDVSSKEEGKRRGEKSQKKSRGKARKKTTSRESGVGSTTNVEHFDRVLKAFLSAHVSDQRGKWRFDPVVLSKVYEEIASRSIRMSKVEADRESLREQILLILLIQFCLMCAPRDLEDYVVKCVCPVLALSAQIDVNGEYLRREVVCGVTRVVRNALISQTIEVREGVASFVGALCDVMEIATCNASSTNGHALGGTATHDSICRLRETLRGVGTRGLLSIMLACWRGGREEPNHGLEIVSCVLARCFPNHAACTTTRKMSKTRERALILKLLLRAETDSSLQRLLLVEFLPDLLEASASLLPKTEAGRGASSYGMHLWMQIMILQRDGDRTSSFTTITNASVHLASRRRWPLSLSFSTICAVLLVLLRDKHTPTVELLRALRFDDPCLACFGSVGDERGLKFWNVVTYGLAVARATAAKSGRGGPVKDIRASGREDCMRGYKRCMLLLRVAIETALETDAYGDFARRLKSGVDIFLRLYDGIDAFNLHMIEPIWHDMLSIRKVVRDDGDAIAALLIPFPVEEILLSKMMNHMNPVVQRFVLKALFGLGSKEAERGDEKEGKCRTSAGTSAPHPATKESEGKTIVIEGERRDTTTALWNYVGIDFVCGEVLRTIDSPSFFRKVRGIVFKTSVKDFFVRYCAHLTNMPDRKRFLKCLIRSSLDVVMSPSAVLPVLSMFDSTDLPPCENALDAEDLAFLSHYLEVRMMDGAHASFICALQRMICAAIRTYCTAPTVSSRAVARFFGSLRSDAWHVESSKFRRWIEMSESTNGEGDDEAKSLSCHSFARATAVEMSRCLRSEMSSALSKVSINGIARCISLLHTTGTVSDALGPLLDVLDRLRDVYMTRDLRSRALIVFRSVLDACVHGNTQAIAVQTCFGPHIEHVASLLSSRARSYVSPRKISIPSGADIKDSLIVPEDVVAFQTLCDPFGLYAKSKLVCGLSRRLFDHALGVLESFNDGMLDLSVESEVMCTILALRMLKTCVDSSCVPTTPALCDRIVMCAFRQPGNGKRYSSVLRSALFAARWAAMESLARHLNNSSGSDDNIAPPSAAAGDTESELLKWNRRVAFMAKDAFDVAGENRFVVTCLIRCVVILAPSIPREGDVLESFFEAAWRSMLDVRVWDDPLCEAYAALVFHPSLVADAAVGDVVRRRFRRLLDVGLGGKSGGARVERHSPKMARIAATRCCDVWLSAATVVAPKKIGRRRSKADREQASSILRVSRLFARDLARLCANNEHAAFRGTGEESPSIQTLSRVIIVLFLRSLIDLFHLPCGKEEEVVTENGGDSEHRFVVALVRDVMLELIAFTHEPRHKEFYKPRDALCREKLRIYQALAMLSRALDGETKADALYRQRLLGDVMCTLEQKRHHNEVRYQIEIFAILLVVREPVYAFESELLPRLRNPNITDKELTSAISIAVKSLEEISGAPTTAQSKMVATTYISKLGIAVAPLLSSSVGAVRCWSQFVAIEWFAKTVEGGRDSATTTPSEEECMIRAVAQYLRRNEKTMTIYRKQKYISKWKYGTDQWTGCPTHMFGTGSGYLTGLLDHVLTTEDDIELHAEYTFDGEIFPAGLATYLDRHIYDMLKGFRDGSDPLHSSSAKHAGRSAISAVDSSSSSSEASLFRQRKIRPWSATGPLSSKLLGFDDVLRRSVDRRPRQQIIVVASLVDKVPNLAGLARTCEIFRANKLVIPDLKLAKEKLFSQISVTAAKWIPLEGVSEANLPAYLRGLSRQGYAIVGLEQSTNSTSLENFRFPERIALLLGKEKEGIPGHLLSMLDHCIEIPQQGLIRSLNVHVSGSLLLWEYTRQRLRGRDVFAIPPGKVGGGACE
eukprot:g1245.t1